MRKNLTLLLFSIIFSLTLVYLFSYVYILLNLDKNRTYEFNSIETLNFHKKYSNKIHHLKFFTNASLKKFERDKNFKKTEYLFATINEFRSEQKNILLQGDSWAEVLTNPVLTTPNHGDFEKDFGAMNFVKNFTKLNNLGFINAGIVSFSPTTMKLQLEILENDFDITPNIVIAYIDQTDIGDENCRYKDKRVYENNKLIAVKPESYSNKFFDFTKTYAESEIFLAKKNKIVTAFNLLNFKIKFNYKKSLNKNIDKFNRILKYGYKNRGSKKCYINFIQKYLSHASNDEINHFKESVSEYISYVEKKDNIKKLFLVTFPHKKHLPELYDAGELYQHNVSDIVDDLIGNNKKILHLNFTKLALEKKIELKEEHFIKNDPSSHLTPDHYQNFFIKKVINYVFNNLDN